MSLPQGTKLNSLQAGRAMAALLVVAHHANQATSDFIGSESKVARSILEYGYLGVDFFGLRRLHFSLLRNRPHLMWRGHYGMRCFSICFLGSFTIGG